MIMKYLNQKSEVKERSAGTLTQLEWVSKKNASLLAWEYVETKKKEKILYVKNHYKPTDYLIKLNYQIKPSEVAKAIGVSRSTLMHTSSYSLAFSKYLREVNEELVILKEEKVAAAQKSPSRGAIKNSKEELLAANRALKDSLTKLEQQNTKELIRFAFDQLPLPIKKKLGIG